MDQATIDYFDAHAPEYSPRRLSRGIELIRQRTATQAFTETAEHSASAGSRPIGSDSAEHPALIDIGCGGGNVLSYIAEQTGIHRLVGLDVSARCVARARDSVPAVVHEGSILDPETVERFRGQFDIAVMAAVLHHLVFGTRRRSRRAAQLAIVNALALVRPGGQLLIVEPTFAPSPPLTVLFWVKRVVSTLIKRRLSIGGYWNNIGAPVVSFYTPEQLRVLAERAGSVDAFDCEPMTLSPLAARVLRKSNTTIVVSPPAQTYPHPVMGPALRRSGRRRPRQVSG